MNEKRILYSECIRVYNVDEAFLQSLDNLGLLRIEETQECKFVEFDELEELEQFVRWHNELEINAEGIEALHHLLHRVKKMQLEIDSLTHELKFYRSL